MELEHYKKVWEKQPQESTEVSAIDIYKMTQAKSSSIVKWIFIIGIIELVFWSCINLLIPQSYLEVYKDFNLINLIKITTYLHYAVILIFLVLFYLNYSSISITDTTKELMNKILKTRRTVKYYVYYNLIGIVVSNLVIISLMLRQPALLAKAMNPEGHDVETNTLIIVFLVVTFVFVGIFFALLWLIYRLTYGKLLKKLNVNYKELIRIEQL